jgi:protein kinase A
MFLGLSFLHSLGIVYRDLKPENVLFTSTGHIKIGDLGFAKMLNPGQKTTSFCGTPSYLAPELLERKPYDHAVDWWTFGVLIFQLCSGCSPFQESHPSKTFTRILNCAIRWPPEPQLYFSKCVFELFMGLFELNPENRFKEAQIRSHQWFSSLNFDLMEKRAIQAPLVVMKNLFPMELSSRRKDSSVSRESIGLSEGSLQPSMEDLFSEF